MRTKFIESIETVVRELEPSQRRVLDALFAAENHAASAGELKAVLGVRSVVQVNAVVGYVGRRVRAVFGAHPDGLADGEYEWWHVIATGKFTKGRGFVWQLRDEVVAGLATPHEGGESDVLVEGAVRQVTANIYERDLDARARCIRAHGYRCAACTFDFGLAYGSAMEGFIHVHHLKTLASVKARHEVNPIEDLVPVCPNCHAVIHSVTPPRSIEEVKAMLAGVPHSLTPPPTSPAAR
ncbi:HNH endonuclease [Hydrogenophaga soli]